MSSYDEEMGGDEGNIQVLGTGAHGVVVRGLRERGWVTKVALREWRQGQAPDLGVELANYRAARQILGDHSPVLLHHEEGTLNGGDRGNTMIRVRTTVADVIDTSPRHLQLTDDRTVIHIEEADGDLYGLTQGPEMFRPSLYRVLMSFREIIRAVCKLSTTMYHCDIRPENILYRGSPTGSLQFFLGDWGSAHIIDESQKGYMPPPHLASVVTPPEGAKDRFSSHYLKELSTQLNNLKTLFSDERTDAYTSLTSHIKKWGAFPEEQTVTEDTSKNGKYDVYGLGYCLLFCICTLGSHDTYVVTGIWEDSLLEKMTMLAFRCLDPVVGSRITPDIFLAEFDDLLPQVIGRGRHGCVVAQNSLRSGWVTKIYTDSSDVAEKEYKHELYVAKELAEIEELEHFLVKHDQSCIGTKPDKKESDPSSSSLCRIESLVAESLAIFTVLRAKMDIRLSILTSKDTAVQKYVHITHLEGGYEEDVILLTGKIFEPTVDEAPGIVSVEDYDSNRLYAVEDGGDIHWVAFNASPGKKTASPEIVAVGVDTISVLIPVTLYTNESDWIRKKLKDGVRAIQYENGGYPTGGRGFIMSSFFDISFLMKKVLACLEALAVANWAHRDIHSGNILWHHATSTIRLIDFGTAVTYDKLFNVDNPPAFYVEHWEPPELILIHKPKDMEINRKILHHKIRSLWWNRRQHVPDIITACLKVNKTATLTFAKEDASAFLNRTTLRYIDLYRAGFLFLGYLSRSVDASNQKNPLFIHFSKLAFEMLAPDPQERPDFSKIQEKLNISSKESYHRCETCRSKRRSTIFP